MGILLNGVNFHQQKLVRKALETFYALGPVRADQIMAKFSLHRLAKMGSLNPRTLTHLQAELAQLTIGNDARKLVQENIQRLKDMGSYRGKRHAMAMPVRGQRTRCQTESARRFNRLERWH
jgi:small subunit ribosomal protein S13